MPSSDEAEQSEDSSSRAGLVVAILRATMLPLVSGLLGIGVLVYFYLYGFPARTFAIVALTLTVCLLFGVPYCYIFLSRLERETRIPLLDVDPDMNYLHLAYLSRDAFQEATVDGGELGTRDSHTGKVYLSEGYEPGDPEDDDVPDGPTIYTTWEGAYSLHAFIEAVEVLKWQHKELVPLARQGVEARAAVASANLRNSVRNAYGLITGAEKDMMLDTDVDPFEWDLQVDDDDIIPDPDDGFGGFDLDDLDGPVPESYEMQKEVGADE